MIFLEKFGWKHTIYVNYDKNNKPLEEILAEQWEKDGNIIQLKKVTHTLYSVAYKRKYDIDATISHHCGFNAYIKAMNNIYRIAHEIIPNER